MDKIKALYNSERFLAIVLLLWLATMPFGAFVGKISLGILTLYPNLIITLLLLPLFFFTFRNWKRTQWIFLLIIFLLLIQSVGWILLNGANSNAIFDTRSLIFYVSFTLVLFSVYSSKNWESLREILKKGIRYYFVIVLIAGIIEFFTGIHFVGTFTEKLATQPVNSNFYAPIFIYDNPNTYLTYLMGLFALMIVLDSKLKDNFWMKTALLLIILIFAIFASSRFVVFASCFWMLVELLFELKTVKLSKNYAWLIVGTLLGGILILNQTFFLGTKFGCDNDKYVVNQLNVVVETDNSILVLPARDVYPKEKYSELVDAYYSAGALSSDELRKNLILNGWQFIKEKPIFGIGPGQYREYIDHEKGDFNVGSLHSPHNYVIEMWSQFGLLAIVYLAFSVFILFKLIVSKINLADKKSYLLVFFTFGILMMVPSGFLLLDINWLFLPLIIIATPIMMESKQSKS